MADVISCGTWRSTQGPRPLHGHEEGFILHPCPRMARKHRARRPLTLQNCQRHKYSPFITSENSSVGRSHHQKQGWELRTFSKCRHPWTFPCGYLRSWKFRIEGCMYSLTPVAVRGRQCYDYTIREHAAQKLDAPASHRCQKLFTAERLGLRNIDGMVSVGKIALSGLRRLRRRLRPCAGILQAST